MKNRIIIFLITVFSVCLAANAVSWDYIRTSGEYYYGMGMGSTEAEADAAAMADISSQIATHVSGDFNLIDDISFHNGDMTHESRVLNCVRTYSQSTLTNTEKWVEGKAPKITVKRYMKRDELSRIFNNRIAKAKSMISIADECLEKDQIDMALQYYYWSYSLLRSLQFPNEVTDYRGKILVDWLPVQINSILSDIKIIYEGQDGDYCDFLFTYREKPVSSIEFSYSDGRAECVGLVQNGKGVVEMIPGYNTDVYHLDIEYEFKTQARGDVEMESVLGVITPKSFPKAAHKIKATSNLVHKADPTPVISYVNEDISQIMTVNESVEEPVVEDKITVNNDMAPKVSSKTDREQIIKSVLEAVSTKNYSGAAKYFTVEGLKMFNRLVSYGRARVLDASNIKFYKGLSGRTIARGAQMSFTFSGRNKKTFVEEVTFAFDKDNRIESVAFGLGSHVEKTIFENSAAQWSPEVRETIVSFMENYKTAYSLERFDYISDIFADDALIIVGHILKKSTANPGKFADVEISQNGRDIIKYNKLTKKEYLANLKRVFNNNEFINLKFTNHELQWLDKFENQVLFAINIRQEYCSSTYSDDGYLFLMVDMTDCEQPLIKVRTWQPNEVSINKLFNAGDFFDD